MLKLSPGEATAAEGGVRGSGNGQAWSPFLIPTGKVVIIMMMMMIIIIIIIIIIIMLSMIQPPHLFHAYYTLGPILSTLRV